MNDLESDREKVGERALVFLRAALNPELRRIMSAAGYCDAEHSKGWSLVAKTSGFVGGPNPFSKHAIDKDGGLGRETLTRYLQAHGIAARQVLQNPLCWTRAR